jgi:hypothetical protein
MATTTNLNRALEAGDFSTLPSVAEAQTLWADFRVTHGFAAGGGKTALLAPPDANVKIGKNEVPTWSLTLTPADLSGQWNLCTWATQQCKATCVMWTAGRGVMRNVREGRLVRTAFLATHPGAFLALLTDEVRRLEAKGVPFGLRLNVASDLRWENIAPWLFNGENVRAYDYTKAPHLGIRVIDGDLSDYRYGDPQGVIVGLAAKGAAKGTGAEGAFVKIGRKAA